MSAKTSRNRRKPDGLLLHRFSFFLSFVSKNPSTFEARIMLNFGTTTHVCLYKPMASPNQMLHQTR